MFKTKKIKEKTPCTHKQKHATPLNKKQNYIKQKIHKKPQAINKEATITKNNKPNKEHEKINDIEEKETTQKKNKIKLIRRIYSKAISIPSKIKLSLQKTIKLFFITLITPFIKIKSFVIKIKNLIFNKKNNKSENETNYSEKENQKNNTQITSCAAKNIKKQSTTEYTQKIK